MSVTAAIGGAGQAAGGVASLLSTLGVGRRAQRKQQEKLNESAARTNYMFGEMAADSAQQRQQQNFMFEAAYNSPEAQAQRLKDAGLNVGLMMSGGAGGAGGTAHIAGAPQGGGSMGAQAGQADSPVAKAMAALGLQKASAEIDLLRAQGKQAGAGADLAEAQAENTRGVDREHTQSLIAMVEQTIQSEQVRREAMKVETRLNEIAEEFARDERSLNIRRIENEVEHTVMSVNYLAESITEKRINNEITAQQAEALINQAYENVKNTIADSAMKWANQKLANADEKLRPKMAEQIQNQIDTNIRNLDLTEQRDIWNNENTDADRALRGAEAIIKRDSNPLSTAIGWVRNIQQMVDRPMHEWNYDRLPKTEY